MIFWQRDNDYTMNEIFYTREELESNDFHVGDFKNSANFYFGIEIGDLEPTGFDILNNPYIEFVGFAWNFTDGIIKYLDIDHC